jgi:hypothetical protein
MTAVEFSKEEARVLLQLLDVAVKAAGLPAAEAVAVLSKKIEPAAAEPAPEPGLALVPDATPAEG